MIKLVTDSSADLPKALIQKYDITIVPLTVRIDQKDYAEGVGIQPREFFEKMFATEQLPITSQPSPAAFAEVFSSFGEDVEVLCLTISSGLSGTYQSASIGKELCKANVTVFDTLAGSLGHGMQIIRAAELANAGHTLEEILKELDEYRANMNVLVLLNTLENIVKGGRLSKFQGSLAKILNYKILLDRIDGGKVGVLDKIRGKKKAQNRIMEIIQERGKDFSKLTFGITHTGNIEEAKALKQKLDIQFHPKEIIVNYMGATMGTYAGKDGMIISF